MSKFYVNPIHSRGRERLPYGNKSKGRYIKGEEGRRDVLIPSFGVLEKEEIDYIAEAQMEKEDARVRSGKRTETGEKIELIARAMKQAPKGTRGKLAEEIMGTRRE